MDNSMKWKGLFGGSTSWNNLKIDLVKSGIQKYIRRGDLEKAIWMTIELDLFSRLDGGKAESIRTNMINRIKVILVEEIFDWSVLQNVFVWIRKWQLNRSNENKSRFYLLNIVKTLVESKKIRIISDSKAYLNQDNIADKLNNSKYNSLFETKNEWDNNMERGVEWLKPTEMNNLLLKEYFSRMLYLLEKKNMNAIYWMNKIIQLDSKERRYRRKGNVWLIWDYLLNVEYVKENPLFDTTILNLFELYKDGLSEKMLFILSAILYHILEIDWDNDMGIEPLTNSQVRQYYTTNMELNKIELDDYIYDWHSGEGRKKGKNLIDFAKEGSLVENQDNRYLVPLLRELYIDWKVYQTSLPKNKKDKGKDKIKNTTTILENELENDLPFVSWDEFQNIKLCMENTCGNKVMCMEASYKGREVVIKEMNQGFNYGRDCLIVDESKELFGLTKIGIERVRCDQIMRKIDKKKLSWVENCHLIEKPNTIYLIMNKFNGNILNKTKNWHLNNSLLKQYCKIGLFRGLFLVTDFNTRNVLLNPNTMELCSIDENNIGNRKDILGKDKSKFNNNPDIVKEVIEEIIEDSENKLKTIKKIMEKYQLVDKYEIVCQQFANISKNNY